MNQLELSEILCSLSLTEELANGNPMETSLRTAWLASFLAKEASCNSEEIKEASLTTLLRFPGCISFASEESNFLRDDIYFKRSFATLDYENKIEILQNLSIGATNKEIGLVLNPPHRTVQNHSIRIYEKDSVLTKCKEFKDRSHYIIGEQGWKEVVTFTQDWIEKNRLIFNDEYSLSQ